MSAPPRIVVVAVVVAATLALNAQENCPPPAQPVLHWVGQSSGCTAENGMPCWSGEPIVFSVTPVGGGPYPECTTYLWDFGDGSSTSTTASPSHLYAVINGTFFVLVRVWGGNVDVFTGKQLMILSATVLPVIERFNASATVIRRGQTLVLSWSTKHATRVQIDPIGVGLDATVTSYSFAPAVTQTYTLTAFGAAAIRVTNPLTVVVGVGAKRRAVRH
ncbi:MAG TPA: PKD domain-containing protein [Thermoanaerobaculia bacterium]|nr:PKD domain-containing protein [Thermoanaerobaculia bacterium]